MVQCIEPAVADLVLVTDVLCEAASQFDRVSRVAQSLEEEKSELVPEVTLVETKVRDLSGKEAELVFAAAVAKAEIALLWAEADAARCREAEVGTS